MVRGGNVGDFTCLIEIRSYHGPQKSNLESGAAGVLESSNETSGCYMSREEKTEAGSSLHSNIVVIKYLHHGQLLAWIRVG